LELEDSHALDGIFCTISASVLRALMRCGSLQARSVNLRDVDLRELKAFRTIVLMLGDGEPDPSDLRLGHAI
jgi:hypothetical protein